MKKIVIFILVAFFGIVSFVRAEDEDFFEQRENMVELQIKGRGVRDEKVLDAMLKVKRHNFLPNVLKRFAYLDQPLPIGEGQTISQPYIVALMTELARIREGDRVRNL